MERKMNFLNKINKQDKVQIYIDPNYSAIGWIDFIGPPNDRLWQGLRGAGGPVPATF